MEKAIGRGIGFLIAVILLCLLFFFWPWPARGSPKVAEPSFNQAPRHSEDWAEQVKAKFEEMDKELEAEGCVKGKVVHAIFPTPDNRLVLMAQCTEWKEVK